MMSAKLGKNCSCCVLIAYCTSILHHVGTQWSSATIDMEVYTVQDPHFWGPVTMLVPRNCSLLKELKHHGQQHQDKLLSTIHVTSAATMQDDMAFDIGFWGYPVIPAGVDRHDIADVLQHKICGVEIDVAGATPLQWWVEAMMTARRVYQNAAGLHLTRFRLFWLLMLGTVLSLFSRAVHDGTMKATTRRRQAVEAAMRTDQNLHLVTRNLGRVVKFMSCCYRYLSQLWMCSLFLMLEEENHFVMSYEPGMAYILLLLAPMALWLAGLLQVMLGMAVVKEGDVGAAIVACLLAVVSFVAMVWFMLFVAIPVEIFQPLYSLQFMFVAFVENRDVTLPAHSDAHWQSSLSTLSQVSRFLFVINLVDFLIDAFILTGDTSENEHGDLFFALEGGE